MLIRNKRCSNPGQVW